MTTGLVPVQTPELTSPELAVEKLAMDGAASSAQLGDRIGDWLAVPFAPLGIDTFEHVTRLPLLITVAVLAIALVWRVRAPAVMWPGLDEIRAAGARRLEPIVWLALVLRATALAALAGVLAGPVALRHPPPEPGLGLDLVVVLDTSGSMASLDARSAGRTRTRLELAREVVGRFARERVAEGDRVGLVVFGDTAFTQCPLTSDGALLAAALQRTRVGMAGEATALGDALALAVKRAGGAPGSGSGNSAGRLVVLLTDGRSNAGAIPLDMAAELAAAAGIRVHTVGIGVGGEEVPVATRPGAPTAGLRFERHDPDLESLESVAAITGGRFHHARRASDLSAVYAEIDALERVPRPLPPRQTRAPQPEPLLAAAGAALLLELALARVARRRIP